MVHTEKKAQEKLTQWAQILILADKDFKATILNMLKELKETI